MRIAQIAPLYESCPPKLYGGTERIISYLTEALVAAGHDVTLFASGDSTTSARLSATCERSIRLEADWIGSIALHTIMIHRVAQLVDEFDVLHFHTYFLHFASFEPFAHKVITTLHSALDSRWSAEVFEEFPTLKLVSVSDAQREPVPDANWVKTIPHGLPADLYGFGHGRGGYLAFVGRLSYEKRPDRAVAIARGAGIALRVAARADGLDRSYFETTIAPLFADPLVQFVGEIDDARKDEFYGDALGLLFPIDWAEPFGLVMIEAMATGTPTIAFRRGSVEEIIEDGLTGFVVDTVDEAIAAVGKLESLDRRAIRARFLERFTIGRARDAYVDLYGELIDRVI